MLEIENSKITNTMVICPILAGDKRNVSAESRLTEALGLTVAINLNVVYSQILNLKEIKPATYFSKGFLEKVLPIVEEKEIFLMVVDASLTPIQQRNLEKTLKIKVIDRTALILEIFGERAQTSEGKLQVELAHLTYQRSRLVRSWTHLERQRGGAGFLGGPGEKQIEIDKRIIDDKIVKIKKELEKVKNTRTLQRSNRKKVPYPIVALVGYTNAGKSSLFNRLTKDEVFVADQLFATLDPTLRKIKLPSGMEIVLSDTVGFISDLPHELVMAFRSTLEEVLEADLVLHVRDVSNPDTAVQRKDVLDVLHHLGLKEIEREKNYVEVLNKIDLISYEDLKTLEQKLMRQKEKNVAISALTGQGCEKLLQLIDDKLTSGYETFYLNIFPSDGKSLSFLYQNSNVSDILECEDTIMIRAKTDPVRLEKIKKMLPQYSIQMEKKAK